MDQTKPTKYGENLRLRSFHAWLTRSCIVTFALLLLLLHLLDRELNPITTTMSEYALGDKGSLMVAAFVVLGLGTVALAFGLLLLNSGTKRAKIAFLLLASVGVSLIVTGLFKTNHVGSDASVSGFIHDAASMIGLTMAVIAMAQWTRQIAGIPQLMSHSRFLARLTFLSAVLFVLFLISCGFAAGLVQRVFISSILAWQLYASRVVLT